MADENVTEGQEETQEEMPQMPEMGGMQGGPGMGGMQGGPGMGGGMPPMGGQGMPGQEESSESTTDGEATA